MPSASSHTASGQPSVIVVGAGLGGLSAAITAADRGLDVILLEAGPTVGGAAGYSGGQVWVGGNNIAEREGIDDSVEQALRYVQGAASRDTASVDPELAREWLEAASRAARYFETQGVIRWAVVPDYPDYYYPDVDGSAPTGRYLTSTPYDGRQLGADRERLHVSPHFPVGVTYGEMFSWGGLSSKTAFDWELVAERRATDTLTFGTGITAPFFQGALDRGVDIRTGHRVVALEQQGDAVVGVRVETADGGELRFSGPVILATGAHDWSQPLMERFTGIPSTDGGSVAPSTLRGDAVGLVEAVGGAAAALPAWAAPVLPGYRLDEPTFPGDSGFRACYEHCLPHTFIVDRTGSRFCDDSFHSKIVAHVLRDQQDADFPIHMVWDSQHHRKYGLGATMPGGEYPEGLVVQGATLAELAEKLGVPGGALQETADRYNAGAGEGEDREFGRGGNLSVRRFRGDGRQSPNPCVGPVVEGPFFGMRLRLLSTGIAAAGVRAGSHGRVERADGSVIDGLYAVGECSARAAAGVGYNSGYSLSRAMAFGFLAANEIADAHAG